MITAFRSDLTKLQNVDYIVNAANAKGPMDSGIAGAIRINGGTEIQDAAMLICSKLNYQPGDIYVTHAGRLSFKKIIHLVTMENPGGVTSYDIVRKCLQNLILYCKVNNIKKIALPALGTGVGGLDIDKIAGIFKEILGSVEEIEFLVVDIDPMFIYNFK
ncbi:gp122 [Bacillus phage G]|uniref:Gp122 n=1 Tax=Bacillus phage G TaxID=2884420 RepID=G3MBI4_9CAUD|nr:gp122 [Bacillus phage G]AEO93384.1 gp122 [Bacillus phage G]